MLCELVGGWRCMYDGVGGGWGYTNICMMGWEEVGSTPCEMPAHRKQYCCKE